ncbi:MAG: tetratricopeptide repeat protein [Bacteroidales bacterium]
MKIQYKGKIVQKQDEKISSSIKNNDISVVFRIHDFEKEKKLLIDSISRIRSEKLNNIEFFITSVQTLSENQLQEIQAVNPLLKIQLHQVGSIFEPSNNHCVIIDCKSVEKSLNLNEILFVKGLKPENATKLKFVSDKKDFTFKQPIWILNKTVASYIVGSQIENASIEYFLRKQQFRYDEVKINQTNPFTKISFVEKIIFSLFNFISWFLIHPIKEINGKYNFSEAFKLNRESSIYRLVFFIIAFSLLFIMPIMSFDAGISGDENEHYTQSEKVFKYYSSLGSDTSSLESPSLKLYGQSFDLIAITAIKAFNIDKIYETRHLINSIFGWMAILFTALIAVELIGWRAGLIGLFLMFISPGFLGHSFNNPKDIPFAMAYIMSLYFMIKWLKEMPRPTIKTSFMVAFAIAIGISIRIGGLLSIAYFGLFVIMYFIFVQGKIIHFFAKENYSNIKRAFIYVAIITALGYFMGLLLWPYGIEAPLKNPINALSDMTNFAVSLRQIFEGKQVWSDNVPWYYLSKYILITVPIIVVFGFALFFGQFFMKPKKLRTLLLFMLVFAVAFPLFYIVWKKSNVFGGWRHTMFVYPPIVAMAAIGIGQFFNIFRKKIFVYITLALILALSYNPIRHIIVNYPHEYVYYNEFEGGIKAAYGNYELDYYVHSLKKASEWVKENATKDANVTGKKILVAAWIAPPLNYYFRKDTAKFAVAFARYYERGNTDWDYAIYVNMGINAAQLKNGAWPPANTIHTIDVDGKPICAILKRTDKSDMLGYQAMQINDTTNAIRYFKKALELVPTNESVLLNLTDLYTKMQKFDSADITIKKLLKFDPELDNALYSQAVVCFYKNDIENTLITTKRIIKNNPKYYMAHYIAAYAYMRKNDSFSAIKSLEDLLVQNQGFKPAYILLSQIYQQQGETDKAQHYASIANQLQ